jgi:CIC family chloride channel protein
VVDENKVLCGIILLDDIRDIMFKPDKYDTSISELMHMPPGYVFTTDSMDTVMEMFQMSGAWNLPVMDDDQYIGFVSKSKIFSVYRRLLIHHSKK